MFSHFVTRAEAKAAKASKFFTGKPCPNGHIDFRWVGGGCVACAKQHQVRHYQANRSAYVDRASKWAKENPEKIAAIKAAYIPNAEKRRASERKRRAKDPEKYRLKVRIRKAQRRGADGSYTKDDLEHIFSRQNGLCAICFCELRPEIREVDHRVPISRGGSNYPTNLQYLCRPCNRRKAAKDPEQFSKERGLSL